jgi:nickel/cobalt transporter (NicO) family protein
MTKSKGAGAKFVLLTVILLAGISNDAVFAHPLGNFTVNHFSRLQISSDRITIRYIIDMAEIPAFQTLQTIDTDNDGKQSAEELKIYAEQNTTYYAGGLFLNVDDAPMELQPSVHSITTPPGAGGLPTLRIEYDFVANVQANGAARKVRYEDSNDRERIGWHEIVIAPNSNISVFDSTAFASTVSDELKAYPEDMLAAPLNERKAELSFTLGAMPVNAKALLTREGRPVIQTRDRLAELITVKELTFPVALLGLLIAAFLGGVHAMSPGHGKTVVGAYLVGSRGTPKHAMFLGLTVTITHTLGVFALGLITLFASQYVVPEKLFPIISLLSGLIVFGLGFSLFLKRLRIARGYSAADHHHEHDHQEHSHDHYHSHGDHGHSHDEMAEHTHQPQVALAHTHEHQAHSHDQAQGHTHSHQEHIHSHDEAHEHIHSHPHEPHSHDHEHPHSHDHEEVNLAGKGSQAFVHSHDGGKPHSHLPPGMDGAPITWKSLLALGISGGLLPCPSALVVLLSAIYMQRTGYGLLLVIAFSMGLAATLTGVGLMFLYAGRLLKRPANAQNHVLAKVLPILSALVIACVGAVMCYEAFMTSGFKL